MPLRLIFGAMYHKLGSVKILEGHAETLKGLNDEAKNEAHIVYSIEALRELSTYCAEIELTEAVKYIEDAVDTLERPVWRNIQRLAFEMGAVLKIVENESRGRWVYYIKRQKSDTQRSEGVQWEPIKEKFRSAEKDIDSARMCFAVDENTACVFHLMRVAEIGLRALARERHVKIPKKPLEWAAWQEILTHLGKKVDEIGRRKPGPTKDAALIFYQGCLGEFGAFKDTYRNVVMHVRKTYDEHEAASALLHVREFMVRLSARLEENDKKAIRWGKF